MLFPLNNVVAWLCTAVWWLIIIDTVAFGFSNADGEMIKPLAPIVALMAIHGIHSLIVLCSRMKDKRKGRMGLYYSYLIFVAMLGRIGYIIVALAPSWGINALWCA